MDRGAWQATVHQVAKRLTAAFPSLFRPLAPTVFSLSVCIVFHWGVLFSDRVFCHNGLSDTVLTVYLDIAACYSLKTSPETS